MGVVDGAASSWSAWSAPTVGTRRAPIGAVAPGAGTLRDQLRIVAGARDFRLLLTTFVLQALATGCMLAGVDYVAARRARPTRPPPTVLFVCFVGPALLLTPAVGGARARGSARSRATSLASLVLAAGALLLPCWPGRRRRLVVVRRDGAGRRRLRRLPGLPAGDAARRRGGRRAPHRREPGRRLHRRLDRRRDARPRARARRSSRWCWRSAATVSSDRRRRRRSPDSALTAIVLGFSLLPAAADRCSAWSGCARYRLDAAEVTTPMERSDRATSSPGCTALQAHDLPVHGGRTLAYVYDSGLAGGRPDRPRGGRGVRRLQRARPDRLPEPAADGERPGRLRRAACSTPRTTAVGTVTSGGTESVLLAVQARARRAARTSTRPRMVLPTTAHAAFHKAAHYFGVEAGAGAGRRGLPRRRPAAMAAGDRRRARCSWWPARRRTPTASSTRSPRSRPRPPRAGSAATSTPASAAGSIYQVKDEDLEDEIIQLIMSMSCLGEN